MNTKKDYKKGIMDAIPIGMAYLAVSFAFGIAGTDHGIPVWAVTLISAMCLTSAGQFAGLIIIYSRGTLIELILSQIIINLRYSIMSITIGQKLAKDTTLWNRFSMAFGVTDEAFAVSCGRPEDITSSYYYGLMTPSWICWVLGTFLGAVVNGALPEILSGSLGIAIYGMLTAIALPPAKHDRHIMAVVILSACCSLVIRYIDCFSFISSGFSIIICTLIGAGIGALLFPVDKEDHDD